MKNKKKNLLQGIARFIGILIIISGCAHRLLAEERGVKAFMETTPARKLSSTLQKQLLEFEDKEDLDQQLDLILGLTGPLIPEERGKLEKSGVVIRSVIGTVATAIAPAKTVPALARLDFVESINLSTRLRPKGDKNEKR